MSSSGTLRFIIKQEMKEKNSLHKTSTGIPAVNLFLCIIVYLFVRSHGQVLGVSDSTSYMKVGESVQFPFTPIENHSYKVELVFNCVDVVLWLPQVSLLQTHLHYEGRVNIQDNIISLERLQLSDSGFYNLKIDYFTGQRPQNERFHLQVFEPVSKPSVTVDCQSGNLTLSCSSSEGSDVTYSWEILPPCGNSCFVQQGSVMEMKVKDGKGKKNYTCTAQNIVSRQSSEPLDLDVCAHNVSVLHYPWIIIPCAVSAFFLTGTLFYIHKRRKKRKHVPDTQIPNLITDGEPVPLHIEPVYIREL